jgi:hypothetical protein
LVCNPRRPEGVPQAGRVIPPASELTPDLHTLLRIALVEADDGLVRALRAIAPTAAFATNLNAAIRAQTGPGPVHTASSAWSVARLSQEPPPHRCGP